MKRLSFITQFKIKFLLPFIGCRKVLGKITILKITSLIWNFFQMAISLLAYVATYPGQLYLPQSNYFDKKVTFSEQLYLQRCYFFEVLPFSEPLPRSLFFFFFLFRKATFLEQNFYRAATSWEQVVLYGRCFSEHRPFLMEKVFRIKTFSAEVLFQTSYFCATFSEELLFGKNNFSEKQYSALATFPGKLIFLSDYFF